MEIFCCPMKAAEVKAKFENRVLKVIVPFKNQMEDAVKIRIE